jgi:radical SAM protein with 4Fe4S-binding SPASM domain
VVPCYSVVYPQIMGDCNKESIYDIWHGEKFKKFRLKMLNGSKRSSKICRECEVMEHRLFPEDDLSGETERLKKIYESE